MPMDELTKAKRLRTGQRATATKLATKVKETLADHSFNDHNFLKQCKMSLNEKIERLRKLDESVSELISTNESETADAELEKEIEESDERRAELQKIVLDIDDRLNSLLQKTPNAMTQANTMSGNGQTQESTQSKYMVRAKLPRLQAKTFDGKIQQWQEFWESFDSAINKNESLSEVDKFTYLRSLLVGPAKSSIAGFALTASNYKDALELLQARYGKRNAIQRAHIQELLNLKPVFNNRELDRLRKLYDTCETNYRSLEAQEVDASTYASIVVPSILEKLPEVFRLTITREKEFLEWSMKDLLDAMRKEIELREAHQAVTSGYEVQEKGSEGQRSYGKKGQINSAAALLARQQRPAEKTKCAYCLEEHEHKDCAKFKDIMERKGIIRKYGRCFVCLKKGHISKNCLSRVSCSACGERHHISICEKPASSRGGDTTNASPNLHVGSESRVALQTAQALVKGSGGGVRTRVLFDSGSHRSFVTTKVVQAANIPVKRKEWIEICTFGQEKAVGRLREVYELEVWPVEGGESVKIEAYGVDNISQVRNEHIECKKHDYPHLKGLWFSDVCKKADVLVVEVLIGADYLWRFHEDRVVRGQPGEPVAVYTKLGWVLSGPMKGNKEQRGNKVSITNFVGNCPSDLELDQKVKGLWDLETLGIKEEIDVHESLKDAIKFNGTRYSVALPWKEGHNPLPRNYGNSLNRLKGQLGKLRQRPEILEEFDTIAFVLFLH